MLLMINLPRSGRPSKNPRDALDFFNLNSPIRVAASPTAHLAIPNP